MKTFDGYKEKSLDNTNVLLAGGGHTTIAEILDPLKNYVTLNTTQTITAQKKIFKGTVDNFKDVSLPLALTLNKYGDSNKYIVGIGLSNESLGWYKSFIGYERTGPYDTGNIVFALNTTSDNTNAIYDDIKYVFNKNGYITASGGFIKKDSSNDYILLGGGDHILMSEFPFSKNSNTVGNLDPLTFLRPWNQGRIYIWKKPTTLKLLKVATIQGVPSLYSGILVKGRFHYRETNDLHTYSTKEIPFQILFNLCYSKDSDPKIWTTAYGKSYNYLKVVRIANSKYEIQVPADIGNWAFVWIEYQYYILGSNNLIPEANDASGTETVLATWEIKNADILPEDYSNYANSAGTASTVTDGMYLSQSQISTGDKLFLGCSAISGKTYMPIRINLNTYGDSAQNLAGIGFSNEAASDCPKAFLGFERLASYDRGRIVIALNDTTDRNTKATYSDIKFSFERNGNLTSTGLFYANSDIRYKSILSYLLNKVKSIAELPIFTYYWKDNKHDDKLHIGSSAQAVKEILPELVTYDESKDFYNLDYATLGTIAGITACKELVNLKSEIDLLKERIKELELQLKMINDYGRC